MSGRHGRGSGSRGSSGTFPPPASADPNSSSHHCCRDISLGFNDLNMNQDGTVMTRDQIVQERIKLGYCETCIDHPTQCFDIVVSMLVMRSTKARTEEGVVYKGVCLRCNPDYAPPRKSGSGRRDHNSRQRGGGHGRGQAAALNGFMDAECVPVNQQARNRRPPPTPPQSPPHPSPRRVDRPLGNMASAVLDMHAHRSSIERQPGSRHVLRGMVSDISEERGRGGGGGEEEGVEVSFAPPPLSPPPSATASFSAAVEEDPLERLKDFVNDLLACDNEESDVIAIGEVSRQMLEDPRSRETQLYGVKALSMMARGSPHCKDAIVGSSALNAIVGAMAWLDDDPQAQDLGCRSLWSLAVVTRHRADVAAAGGCGRMVRALDRHGVGSEQVAAIALGAMKPVSADKRGREALESGGAAAAVVRAMVAHPGAAQIQGNGCAVLSNLVVDPGGDGVSVASPEEAGAILGAMEGHPDDERVQKQACFALQNYSFSDTNLGALRECGRELTDRLQEASRKFPDSCAKEVDFVLSRLNSSRYGRSDSQQDEDLPFSERHAYEHLAAAANGTRPDQEKIEIIANIMLDVQDSRLVQSSGLLHLGTLCRNSDECCTYVANALALAAVTAAMESHGDESMQEKGINILRDVAASSASNRLAVVRSGGCERIAQSAREHPQSGGVRLAALEAFRALTGRDLDSPQRDEIRRTVKDIMSQSGSREVQRQGSEVLRNISGRHLNGSSGGGEEVGDDPAAEASSSVLREAAERFTSLGTTSVV